MTCGTPVAAYPSGSMSKVIDEKVYRSAGERPLKCLLKSLIESSSSIWQGAAPGARERFSADRMVDGYLCVYTGILA